LREDGLSGTGGAEEIVDVGMEAVAVDDAGVDAIVAEEVVYVSVANM
jgi:hypothetical protein